MHGESGGLVFLVSMIKHNLVNNIKFMCNFGYNIYISMHTIANLE